MINLDFAGGIATEWAVSNLFKHGFIRGCNSESEAFLLDEKTIEESLKEYQSFHGLEVDGELGMETWRSMSAPRFCGHPDVMPMQTEDFKWPSHAIKWHVANPGNFQGVSQQQVHQAFVWAWEQWSVVCDIQPQHTSNASEAHVYIDCHPIDKPGGTLAYSQLANNTMGRKVQRYDRHENWLFWPAMNPAQFRIDLARVAAHEIGHVLGIPHIANGNLLQPLYDPRVWLLQAGDISEAVRRYGRPTSAPVNPNPPPVVPVDGAFTITLTGNGKIEKAELTGWRSTKLS